MAKKYFAVDNQDFAYPLSYFMREAKGKGLKEIELFEGIPEKDNEYFFCSAFNRVGAKGFCSKFCDKYLPRNGKKGCCKHYSSTMYGVGKKVIKKVR
jgi:hypothetical protein